MNRVIRFGLVAMILLSLVLTWKIWTNSGNVDAGKNLNVNKLVQEKKPTEVFLPTKLVYHKGNQNKYTNRESLIATLQKELRQVEFEPLEVVSQSSEDFFKKPKNNCVEFTYPHSLQLSYYLTIFEIGIKNKLGDEIEFNRMLISFDEKKIYFVDIARHTVYQAGIKSNIDHMKAELESDRINYLIVSKDHEILPNIYYLEEAIKLKKYSYILATQSYTTFSQAFFSDVNEVYSNDESKNISLSNSEGEKLTVGYQSGEVNFTGKIKEQPNLNPSLNNIFGNTFQYIEKIGSSYSNLRYFDYENNQITYLNYVEGFPVFGDQNKGKIQLTNVANNIHIVTNQETIQVPIPSEEEVELQNTESAIEQLIDRGIDPTKIQDIQIGYTWINNQETKQVVDLMPEWYVKYNNQWQSVANFGLESTKESGGKDGF